MTSRRTVSLLVGVAAGVLTLVPPAMATSERAAAPSCRSGQLVGRAGQSSGGAGTIVTSFVFRNHGRTCTIQGYPRLRLRDASARPLPTRVRHGGLGFLTRPARPVTLATGQRTTVIVAYSDVPVGNETSCKTSQSIVFFLPRGGGHVIVRAELSPCNRGLLRESPFLRGVVSPF